jgi:hypothetical protein
METKMTKTKLPPELEAYFNEIPVLNEAETKELGDAIQALNSDPQFIADEVKEHFLNTILAEMRSQGLNQNQLAAKWGKKRQYVSTILNPDSSKNFTIATMVELAMQVGLRLKLDFELLGDAAEKVSCMSLESNALSRVAESCSDYKTDADDV